MGGERQKWIESYSKGWKWTERGRVKQMEVDTDIAAGDR
jgi:hypothetical protein